MASVTTSRRWWILAAIVAALVIVLVCGELLPSYRLRLATDILIFGLLAMSLDILAGYTGLPSLGHGLYFGSAAYAAAILARDHSESFLLGLAIGVAVPVAIAIVAAPFALRTTGAYFLMITFAFGQLGIAVALRYRSLTGGADGLAAVPKPTLPFVDLDLYDPRIFYYFTAVVVALCGLVAWQIVRSPFGAVLRGVRENPQRMEALGFNVWVFRYMSFLIASALGGVAGVLYAYHSGFVNPETMGLTTSAEVLLMGILGSAGTLIGPLLGAALVLLLEEYTRSSFGDHWRLLIGLTYVATVFVARGGILRLAMAGIRRVRSRSTNAAPPSQPPTTIGDAQAQVTGGPT